MSRSRRACALVLMLVCGFAVASAWDFCTSDEACSPDCHLSCVGCTHAVVGQDGRHVVAVVVGTVPASSLLLLPSPSYEPELEPPRA